MDMSVPEEDEQLDDDWEDREVEKVLYALGKEAIASARASSMMNGNGRPHSKPENKPKPDLEIPRKVLHASIGSFLLSIIISCHSSCLPCQGFFTLYLYVSEGDVRTIVLVLWMALAVIVPGDLLHFRFKGFARMYEKLLGFLMRQLSDSI